MKKLIIVTCITSALLNLQTAHAITQETPVTQDENKKTESNNVTITGKRTKRPSKGATGLSLDIKNTPQSISVISQESLKNFGASNINEAMRLGSGINVEEWETNRTNFMARGFEIVNTQTDGTGVPNNWGIVSGAMDSYGYNKIEVIRGANGLLTGVGNSSGTINYIRKRPTNTQQGELNFSVGSYQFKRIEADYSQPLTDDKTWSIRLVAAAESKNSHVRDLHNKRAFFYGVVDGQIGDNGLLTLGYTYQNTKTKNNMWGGLVFAYDDGSVAKWDTSTSTSLDWTHWDAINHTAFIDYSYRFNDKLEGKITYNYRQFEDESKLFYVYTNKGLNKNSGSGSGLFGWPGNWPSEDSANMLEANLTGDFSAFGREHQIIIGANYSEDHRIQFQKAAPFTSTAYGELPSFPFANNAFPEPLWGNKQLTGDITNQRARLYMANKFSFTDKLSSIIGFNAINLTRKGLAAGKNILQKENEISPYAGLTYDLTDESLTYISYSDIYQNQDNTDYKENFLPAMKGLNYEVGVKSEWIDKRLLTTFAIFKAKQAGLGTLAGVNDKGVYYYNPVDVQSQGIELEVTGRINKNTNLVLFMSKLNLKGNDGKDVYEWVPRRTLGFMLTGNLAQYTPISWGIGGQWRDKTSNKTAAFSPLGLVQNAYAVINAFAEYKVDHNLSIRFNLNNVGDKKFITSLNPVGFYGAPRNAALTLSYKL